MPAQKPLIMDEISQSEIPAMLEMALTRAPLSIKRHIKLGGVEYVVSVSSFTNNKKDTVYLQMFKPTEPKPKKKGKKNDQKRTGRKTKSKTATPTRPVRGKVNP